jgi:hypothetical protein
MDIDEFLEKETKNLKEMGPKAKIMDTYVAKDITFQNKNITIEITNLKQLMKDGRFGDAGKLYFSVRKRYSDLIRQQLEEKHQIFVELSNINKDLIENLNILRIDMDKKASMIKDLITKGLEHLSHEDLTPANQIYLQIREIFRVLPDAFPEKKLLLENDVLTYYSSLMNKANSNSREKLLEKSQEINNMIAQAFDLVNKNNLEDATKMYNEINKKYNELPQGFLYEKSLLYQKIEMVYEKSKVAQEITEIPEAQKGDNGDDQLNEIAKEMKIDPLEYKDKKK